MVKEPGRDPKGALQDFYKVVKPVSGVIDKANKYWGLDSCATVWCYCQACQAPVELEMSRAAYTDLYGVEGEVMLDRAMKFTISRHLWE